VLLTTLVLGSDGLTLMPVVIVAVAISYVTTARLAPPAAEEPAAPATPAPAPAPAPTAPPAT
jgi:UDP-N-acetylmuramyl pentapeptide phosphotransferase/UDP-N-acetylglucosamine-1-phosphate transferase